MKRLAKREAERYGDLRYTDEATRENSKAFLAWAERYDDENFKGRSKYIHEEWMKELSCPVVKLMGDLELMEQHVFGQKTQFANDPNLARKGRFNVGAIVTYSTATPPPAFIADVSYGISNKTTLGITGGTTGALALYGIKFNMLIAGSENKRLLFRFLSVYYPERDRRFMFDRKPKYVMPWFLTMAVIDGEWKLKNRMRLNVGIGLMENHCLDDMKMWFDKNHDHHDMGHGGELEGSLIDVFTTLQAGVAFPVSQRLTLKLEAIAVFHEMRLIHKDEFKVTFPINPFLYFVYAF